MKQLMLIFVSVMLFGLDVKAQDNTPDISGVWKRKSDGLSWNITQNGNNITLKNSNTGFSHIATGKYKDDDIFKGVLARTTKVIIV